MQQRLSAEAYRLTASGAMNSVMRLREHRKEVAGSELLEDTAHTRGSSMRMASAHGTFRHDVFLEQMLYVIYVTDSLSVQGEAP